MSTSTPQAFYRSLTELDFELARGSHHARADGVCLLEAVAWAAGEAHSDKPVSCCKTIILFGQSLNDLLPDRLRSKHLVPIIPLLVGTNDHYTNQVERGLIAAEWAICKAAPVVLRATGFHRRAAELANSVPRLDWERSAAIGLEALKGVSRACGYDSADASRMLCAVYAANSAETASTITKTARQIGNTEAGSDAAIAARAAARISPHVLGGGIDVSDLTWASAVECLRRMGSVWG